jgi:peptidoglycan hydrolase-like protein with peptidoglycan-binding domain
MTAVTSRAAAPRTAAAPQPEARAATTKPVPPAGLSRGAKGEAVKQLQDRLIDLKLLPASVKTGAGYGSYGPQTEAAVKAFQKSVGLQQVGSFGPKTHEAMVKQFTAAPPPAAPPAAKPIPPAGLERNAKGEAVKQLQDRLIDLRYLPASVREGAGYGSFGPMTESAVKAFQADRGLPQVGKFGPATRTEMERALKGLPPLNDTPAPAPGGGIFPPPKGFAAIKATFGEAGKNLTTTQLPIGPGGKLVSVTLHEKMVPIMKACLEDARKKDLLKHIKTFDAMYPGFVRNKRDAITGKELQPPQPSVHSWGIAFDINPNPRPGKVHPDLVKHFKDWGFTWGGDFSSNFDPMHFQYASGY